MLYVSSASMHIRLGAVLSALIIVLCIIGLTMHQDFYDGKIRRDFFFFYTNLSNLIVLIYFALIAPRLYTTSSLYHLIPHAEFAVMMIIMLTCCIFHFILFPAVYPCVMSMPRTREFQIVVADNLIVHYLVPLSVFFYWLLCSPGKYVLQFQDAVRWTAVPLLYIITVFIRAPLRGVIKEVGCAYPYPFLDVQTFGTFRVVRTCTTLYFLCTSFGTLIIMGIRLLFALIGHCQSLIFV